MKREFLFIGKRVDNGELVEGLLMANFDGNYSIQVRHDFDGMEYFATYKVDPKTVGLFTGVVDKNGKRLFEGSKFTFWVCYPTTQTHTGDNIPNGSYTEPDETQFLKLEAEVYWDEDRAKWSFSILGKVPYQFSQYFNFGWYDEDTLPIINRSSYSLEYIKEYYGYDEISDEEWQEYLSDAGFASEKEMMKEVNEIEVTGNIHDVKEQLVNEAT